jgi:hypothetical protein
MMEFLRGKASDRKLRLLACACCRLISRWVTDARSRQGVEIAERYADGGVVGAELGAAATTAWAAYEPDEFTNAPLEAMGYAAAHAAACVTGTNFRYDRPDGQLVIDRTTWHSVRDAVGSVLRVGGRDDATDSPEVGRDHLFRRRVSDLIRCITGNPCRPLAADPSWLSWDGGTVVKLAEAIYQGRAFDRLPVLADALQDAGCQDDTILDHCRHPGPHARGCWVVDVLTERS